MKKRPLRRAVRAIPGTRARRSTRREDHAFPIVGVGASAGGLEAFKQLLAPLSAASPFALVLLQHLDPTHASLLCAALSQTSKLPLAEARDGEQVEAGKVYVLPANATLSIRKGTLQLSPRRASRPHMPSMDFSGRSRRMWGLAQ